MVEVMKRRYIEIAAILAFLFLIDCNKNSVSEVDDPCTIIEPMQEYYEPLSLGEIRPEGWIRYMMVQDMNGFVGNLDRLVPEIILEDDIYGKDRRSGGYPGGVDPQELSPDEKSVYMWWNSESQSNWRDGFIAHAILLGDSSRIDRTRAYVRRILDTQDPDGYLGIYTPDFRYDFDSDNGELWAKATLLRGLLKYYEAFGEEEVLDAIIRAVENVMDHYPPGASEPFNIGSRHSGGLTHGLTITDVLDRLSQLTGDPKYREYTVFLYEDYCKHELGEADIQYQNIMDTGYRIWGHGVHVYESLRPLVIAWYASGNPKLGEAVEIYKGRIGKMLTPAGGPIGDEWIVGRTADATHTGYEYCSSHELLHSYAFLMQKTGDLLSAENIERILFNAALGAKNGTEQCIAYLKTDNSYAMTGTLNGAPQGKEKQTRYKYSPAHEDVAVCCVPNAGRILPYYLQHMWMKDADGFVNLLHGPSVVRSEWKGTPLRIETDTDYPYKNHFRIIARSDERIDLQLKIRIPEWVDQVRSNDPYEKKDGFLVFDVTGNEAGFSFYFDTGIKVRSFGKKEHYFTRGALVYALPIQDISKKVRSYPLGGFHDYHYLPAGTPRYGFTRDHNVSMTGKLEMSLNLFNTQTGNKERVKLVPVGKTLLRQVTF